MNNKEISKRLSRAVVKETPDMFDKILLSCENEKGAKQNMKIHEVAPVEDVIKVNKKKKYGFAKVAVAFVTVMAIYMVPMGYNHFSVDSVIGIDVNPGIEIRTNNSERVLSVTPLTGDAIVVLDGMDLKNVDLDVAINALVGSMLKNGYVSEIKNSILITVENSDTQKGAQLQERLANEIDSLLSAHALNAAVISQTVSEDERLRALAIEHNISIGKVALIDLLVSQDNRLKFEDLAKLNINEINLLIVARHTNLEGVIVSGQASSGAYVGDERAKEIAFQHAGVNASEATMVRLKLDYDDGQMVYELEFDTSGANYEYEIDALSGEVRSYDRDVRLQTGTLPTASTASVAQVAPSTSSTTTGAYIGEAKAKSIALNHAGLKEADVTFIKSQWDWEDGRAVYDVEFYSGNIEYDYEIDAITGDILEHDRDIENYIIPRHTAQTLPPATSTAPATTTNYIGEAKAKSIALNHAGLKEADVTFIKSRQEWDDGKAVYDVEFYSGNIEYDYEIDAITGNIREHDRDVENYFIPQHTAQTSPPATNVYIGEAKAKSIALNHAGLFAGEVTRMKVELDRDDGKHVYEVEFNKGNMEYSYDIDATSGTIRSWDHDYDD